MAKPQLIDSMSVVIPVYNGAATVGDLVDQLLEAGPSLAGRLEIVLVEDAGSDESWEVITRLHEANPATVRAFRLMRNFGQQNALLLGIRRARYDVIVTMDDDLQHPVDQIPVLLAALEPDVDVVYGRPQEEQHGFVRDLASRMTKYALKSAMGADTARSISAFRAFRRPIVEAFAAYNAPTVNLDVMMTWGTTRFAAVDVRHDPRLVGESNYTISRLITHTINMVTGFSTVPLQLASLLGFLMTGFGLGVLAFVTGRLIIEGGSAPGFPFLASIIAIFSGAQMFAIGIIGEYLARMHFSAMARPAYLVRDELEHAVSPSSDTVIP